MVEGFPMFMIVLEGLVWLVAILALVFASAGLGVLLGHLLVALRRIFGPGPHQNQKL